MASVQVRSVGPAREAYVPRGPVPATVEAIDALVDWARDAKMARLLVEPGAPATLAVALAQRQFSAAAPMQPQHTRILQLRPPDKLLKTFKQAPRYNIRAGLRREVAVKEGKDAATLDCFFDELGPERSAAVEAISMDMSPAFLKSATAEGHAIKAVICYDPFHVVQVRHEAPCVPSGGARPPPPGCRSSSVKLRAV